MVIAARQKIKYKKSDIFILEPLTELKLVGPCCAGSEAESKTATKKPCECSLGPVQTDN